MNRTAPPQLKSWWARKWAETLPPGPPESRGKNRHRPRGARLRSLDPATGEATVEVSTSSVMPYEVRVAVAPIAEEAWQKAFAALAGQSLFLAKLLASDLPPEAEEAFVAAGTSLFPSSKEIRVRCNCTMGTGGCRHSYLAQRALAEAIDRDPFLLFDLRGRPRGQVLAALGMGETAPPAAPVVEIPTQEALVPADPGAFRRLRADLLAVSFHIAAPERPLMLLTRLGDPPGWHAPPSMLDALAPTVEAAAKRARDIAAGEDAPGSGPGAGSGT